jgi:FKBP-type peptidyl-prolyl cis-trans isomerase
MIFTLAGSGFAENPAAKTNAVSRPAGFTDQQLIETWGWIVAQQEDIAGIKINRSELASWLKGFSAGVHGQASPCDLATAAQDLDRLCRARRAKLVRAVEKENEAVTGKFFNELKKNTNIVTLPGGLRYEIVKSGSGPCPKPQQTVNVHYTGHLSDGTEFVQFGPSDMILVTNHAPFPAWVAGMQKINRGGIIKLFVPPPLPEREARAWGIPPGSVMIFEVELLDIRNTDAQSLADALMPPPPEPLLSATGLTTARLFEAWGWSVAQKTRAAKFGLQEEELAALAGGLELGINGKPCRQDLPAIVPVVEQFVNDHRKQAQLVFQQKQLADMENFFAGLKKNPNVVEQPSGLRYEILQPGDGTHPKPDQYVKVNYVGRLLDGTVFDRTDPSLGPLDIKIGTVIPGWNEGVQQIGKGGRIKLYVPPSLGYGDVATGGIPPYSTLIFEIELLDIKDTLDEVPPPSNGK